MHAYFVRIKCQLGESYTVANRIAELEIASEIYSTAGSFDLLVKLYLEDDVDVGQFVNTHIHAVDGIRDTETLVTFRAF
ncbi:Lrp/AsnC ligand binding domain-containing protein [Granulosicoccus sp. 3-233]|uniref:Lrp/AsnC ligand binding domain-containing protein n=1 Tax=Granulosicoccus sp. 3-233 TaxID=3417969 RepID=UPI003D3501B8